MSDYLDNYQDLVLGGMDPDEARVVADDMMEPDRSGELDPVISDG